MSEIHDCGRMAGCPECPRGDERRERYAAAQYALSVWADRVPWEELEEYERAEWYPSADAAMAVADAELNHESIEWAKTARKLLDENARLREELDTERYQAHAAREQRDESEDIRDMLVRRIGEHEDTIERVRAALDFCDRGSAIAIRAALEGES